MRHLTLAATATVVALVSACSEPGPLQPPEAASPSASADRRSSDAGVKHIDLIDACDPATFNAVLGAGTCTRSGGIKFSTFIDRLTKHGRIDAWRIAPAVIDARVGQTLAATNRGGEVHTFTEVDQFGGGIVPLLNQLSGNPVIAPECAALEANDFIPPGGTDSDDVVTQPGTELYQCCIHPWMRTVVHARGS